MHHEHGGWQAHVWTWKITCMSLMGIQIENGGGKMPLMVRTLRMTVISSDAIDGVDIKDDSNQHS